MNTTWLGLEDRVIIITGGASGIGRACAEEAAACGAAVVIADVSEDAGQAAAGSLPGANHRFVRTDITSRDSVEALVRETVAAFGRIDVLVNNAGINIPRLLVDPAGQEELTEQIWDKVTGINLKGTFLCTQAVVRQMLTQDAKGVVVNMASESGSEGSEGQSVYAATKAAVYNLTRSWAKELGKHGVRVVGVAPGILEATALRSDEYERALAYTRGQTVDEMRANYSEKSIPLQRSGKLSEVANTVCFLASPRASYLHGTTVNVSGGKSRA